MQQATIATATVPRPEGYERRWSIHHVAQVYVGHAHDAPIGPAP